MYCCMDNYAGRCSRLPMVETRLESYLLAGMFFFSALVEDICISFELDWGLNPVSCLIRMNFSSLLCALIVLAALAIGYVPTAAEGCVMSV